MHRIPGCLASSSAFCLRIRSWWALFQPNEAANYWSRRGGSQSTRKLEKNLDTFTQRWREDLKQIEKQIEKESKRCNCKRDNNIRFEMIHTQKKSLDLTLAPVAALAANLRHLYRLIESHSFPWDDGLGPPPRLALIFMIAEACHCCGILEQPEGSMDVLPYHLFKPTIIKLSVKNNTREFQWSIVVKNKSIPCLIMNSSRW